MVNGKIKEWHLDEELLLKLATGGTVDISSLLSDYIKNTDIIAKAQLDPSIFEDIDAELRAIQNALDDYRNKDTAITLSDIDDEFGNLLETLQDRIDVLASSIEQPEDIQALINQAIEEQLNNRINSTVDAAVQNSLGPAIDTKFDELLSGDADPRLKSLIDDSVQDALENSSYLQDAQEALLNTALATFATKEELNALSDTVDRVQAEQDTIAGNVEAAQSDITNIYGILETVTAPEEFRQITEDDLDTPLTDKINNAYRMAESLSQRNFMEKPDGNANQVLMFNGNGNLISSDLIPECAVVSTSAELNEIKTTLAPAIYDSVSMTEYYIDRNFWNAIYERGDSEETVRLDNRNGESDVSGYRNFTLANANIATSGITVSFSNGVISAMNTSPVDTATVSFGFYGTKCKLYTTIETSGEPDYEIVKSYDIVVDASIKYKERYRAEQAGTDLCFLCLRNLSEGAHRIDFRVPPGETFTLDIKVLLDDEHSGLLANAHIKPVSFYEGNIYDTGDYVTESQYASIKSSNVSVVTVSDYQSQAIDTEQLNKRLLYATNKNILYYCYQNNIVPLESEMSRTDVRNIWQANIG